MMKMYSSHAATRRNVRTTSISYRFSSRPLHLHIFVVHQSTFPTGVYSQLTQTRRRLWKSYFTTFTYLTTSRVKVLRSTLTVRRRLSIQLLCCRGTCRLCWIEYRHRLTCLESSRRKAKFSPCTRSRRRSSLSSSVPLSTAAADLVVMMMGNCRMLTSGHNQQLSRWCFQENTFIGGRFCLFLAAFASRMCGIVLFFPSRLKRSKLIPVR